MRLAAQRHGAVLMPDLAQRFGFLPICSTAEKRAMSDGELCVVGTERTLAVTGELASLYPLEDRRGNRHVAVTLGPAPKGTRLAVRGKTLFMLIPKASRRKVATCAQCECDQGPTISSMSGYVDLGFAFLLNDISSSQVRQVGVPTVEKFIEWDCKALLL